MSTAEAAATTRVRVPTSATARWVGSCRRQRRRGNEGGGAAPLVRVRDRRWCKGADSLPRVPDLDPFLVLGLAEGSTLEQVETAYRARMALAVEARAAAASEPDRDRIQHQQQLLTDAYELAAARVRGEEGRRAGTGLPAPPALVLSIALGVIGVAILAVAVSTGEHGLYTAVVVLGAFSLLSALYWRHQLVMGWAARRHKEG